MAAADEPLHYRRLRAPAEDQTALIDPPLVEIPALVTRNQALASDWDRLSGYPLSLLREQARSAWLLRRLGEDTPDKPFIATGHQPTLYHPGVWFKNFLLERIAVEVGGEAINLTVDNDAVGSASIRAPAGSLDSPHVEEIPFDAPAAEMPWEERLVIDRDTFATFSDRVLAAYAPLRQTSRMPSSPLVIERLWEIIRHKVSDQELSLDRALVGAREEFERQHGLTEIRENRVSCACRASAWFEFLDMLLSRSSELHSIYNGALAEYRTINHVRSTSHPVPDLARDDEWLEMPLWIWDAEHPQRRRLFARGNGDHWEISDRGNCRLTKSEVWERAIQSPEIRIRPKALITTMYARLILSDLFIHGIGGAKYDELTDAIIRRFFGIEPPAYVTATATVRLPLERPQVTLDDVRELDRRYRETIYHPEVFADDYHGHQRAEFTSLAAQKMELIAHGWQEKQKNKWHQQMTQCNERMSGILEPLREHFGKDRERLLADLHRARILGSREYSFCLFPEEMLVPLLKKLAGIQS